MKIVLYNQETKTSRAFGRLDQIDQHYGKYLFIRKRDSRNSVPIAALNNGVWETVDGLTWHHFTIYED
jgi:hypothetical protein